MFPLGLCHGRNENVTMFSDGVQVVFHLLPPPPPPLLLQPVMEEIKMYITMSASFSTVTPPPPFPPSLSIYSIYIDLYTRDASQKGCICESVLSLICK